MSYIILNNELIAETSSELKSGTQVKISNNRVKDAFTGKDVLVNSKIAKISNDKKWEKQVNEATGWANLICDLGIYPEFSISFC